jgi:hypothetical protein
MIDRDVNAWTYPWFRRYELVARVNELVAVF